MIDLFRQKKAEAAGDVKAIREELLQFIKDQLSKVEGGEGSNIKGMHLFIACSSDEKHLYESVLYSEEPDRFKNEEVQRIADNFAIKLPGDWSMDTTFSDSFPPEAKKLPDLPMAFFIRTQKRSIQKSATAYIKVLNGEAEAEVYTLQSTDTRINIGRDKKVLGEDGFFRLNNIAFPASSKNESNKFISRQHAHIRFDNEAGQFFLFADEGGIPPRNKIKVRSVADATPIKLQSTRNGYELKEGDQIMLGDSAILEFSYSQ